MTKKFRGIVCKGEAFSDDTGTGLEYRYPDTNDVRADLRGKLAGREHSTRVRSAQAIAAEVAESERRAKIEDIISNVRSVITDVKAGQLTAARQDSALRQLARAVLFLMRGELNQ
jgi:hypothetical protein